jgi:hypothetical protein
MPGRLSGWEGRMARYQPYNLKQDKWIVLSYGDQIVPGSFEYALNEIVEEHLDLSVFEPRYRNDDGTAGLRRSRPGPTRS